MQKHAAARLDRKSKCKTKQERKKEAKNSALTNHICSFCKAGILFLVILNCRLGGSRTAAVGCIGGAAVPASHINSNSLSISDMSSIFLRLHTPSGAYPCDKMRGGGGGGGAIF